MPFRGLARPSITFHQQCSESHAVLSWGDAPKANVPKSFEFAHLRDGAASAADTAGTIKGFDDRQTSLLLGHRAHGVRDAYALRHPELVVDACKAIEKHYFAPKKETAKKASKTGGRKGERPGR